MLAGGEASTRDVEMRVRRREDERRRDRGIGDRAVDVGGDRQAEAIVEGLRAGRVARGAGDDLDPVRQIEKALGMGLGGGAEADDGDAQAAHLCPSGSQPA